MAKFKAFWNYQKKKTGEIVIAEEELQEMLDAAWDAGYNQGSAGTVPLRITPQNSPPVPTSTSSDPYPSNIRGFDPGAHGVGYSG